MLPFHSACKGTVAGLLISAGVMLPGVLSAGQLGVVDENVLVIQRPVPIIIAPDLPVVQPPVVVTPVVTPPMVVPPVIDTPTSPALSSRPGAGPNAVASPASTPSGGSKQFSPFVRTIAGGTGGNPTTPSTIIASIRSMTGVQREQAIAYIGKIVDNPAVPESDKAIFASIRTEATGQQ